MEKLKKTRGTIRTRTTRIIHKLRELADDEEFDDEQADQLIDQLEDKGRKLEDLNAQILDLIPDTNEDEIDDETNTSEEYSESIIDMRRTIQKRKVINGEVPRITTEREVKVQVKLPRLTIQSFSGEATKWHSFWGQFETTIHQNGHLASIDKFNYLKSYMEGVAASAISGLIMTPENYLKAIEILKNRFGKKTVAMRSHMNILTSLTSVKRASDIQGLRQLYDTCDTQIKSLESLGVKLETYSSMLYSILLNVIPSDIQLEYTRKLEDEDVWDTVAVLEHLQKELESRERAAAGKSEECYSDRRLESQVTRSKIHMPNPAFSRYPRRPSTTAALSTAVSQVCIFCKESGHKPEACNSTTLDQKMNSIKLQDRCFICLYTGHQARRCRSSIQCNICGKRHHTSICKEGHSENQRTQNSLEETSKNSVATLMTVLPPAMPHEDQVFLQTVVVQVQRGTHQVLARCLLDNGAQQSFVREDLSRQLNLPIISEETVLVNSFGSDEGVLQKQKRVRITLGSIIDPDNCVQLEVLEVPTICGALVSIPGHSIRRQMEEKGIILTDRTEVNGIAAPTELGILIGADHYWSVVPGNIVRLRGALVAVESCFGWSLQGPVPVSVNVALRSSTIMMSVTEEQSLSKCLRQFWELETLGIQEDAQLSKSDCETINQHRSRIKFKEGRYQVQLPWKKTHPPLKDNLPIAMKRLNSLVKRFQLEPALYERYEEVITDYLKQGIVEMVPRAEITTPTGKSFYIPHFAVLREKKKTTQIRVVHDASSSEKGAPSLNDCLLPGPNLNPNLLFILLQFRRHRIALIADVEKAFLQISLDPVDRDFVRFLWIKRLPDINKQPEILHLRMTRVLFGVTASPFLLTDTLKYHFEQNQEKYPEACDLLSKKLYVDDFISGTETLDEARKIYQDATDVFKMASMNLRKWVTNSEELKDIWKSESGVLESTSEPKDQELKVLGISWKPKADVLTFDVTDLLEFLLTKRDTKRGVLQATSRIFDPLGLISPILISVKCLFQRLWILGIDWDDNLPDEIQIEWDQWCQDLTAIPQIIIPRCYYNTQGEPPIRCEVHMFCDASEKAYGAITYLRYQTISGTIGVSLIASKTRVSPLKKLTIPRLELMAALVGARLLKHSLEVFEGNITEYRCWSDSEIVLHWIKGQSKQWKPFIENRIVEIQSLTEPQRWGHCAGQENPADLPSRGCRVKDLLNNNLWWKGPTWLSQHEESWPKNKFNSPEDFEVVLREKRQKIVLTCVRTPNESLLKMDKFKSASQVFRTTAWILRFVHNARSPDGEKIKGPLTAEEIQASKLLLVRQVQAESFFEERRLLEEKRPLPSSSKLSQCAPFLDQGLIRLGGRLQFSNLEYPHQHPMILPGSHRLSELLVKDSHWRTMHGVLNSTITQLREEFWILQGRRLVKKILGRCYTCKRFLAKPGSQVVAPLPSDRVIESPPFTITGIDFAGPLYVRDHSNVKAYIALFTCGVTRAVHLEIVTDLSAEKFMLAFRRFLSRRGVCRTIYSDNAKAFKRAEKDIKALYRTLRETTVQDFAGDKGIKWIYIVERAAWWGGFWERLVRSVKTCLKRTLGRTSLNLEELTTTLTEVEAVLNSRPLTHTFTEVGEPAPLTPAHFLVGQRLTSLPDQDFAIAALNVKEKQLTKKLKHRQMILNQFWSRWRSNYLMELRSAHITAHVKNPVEFKTGDIVLVEEKHLPRQSWQLARIQEVHPGRDGKVRSCSLRLPGGAILRRAIQMLYNLEIESNEQVIDGEDVSDS